MGCDIHMFIEYKEPGQSRWQPHGDEIRGWRDYNMFGLLAGVRSSCAPMFKPRGVPADLSWGAAGKYHLFVSDKLENGERYVKRADAERWVADGSSTFINDHKGEPTWVTDPDSHTHHWLTAEEYTKVVRRYMSQHDRPHASYYAIMSALDAFVANGLEARVVFWFDS